MADIQKAFEILISAKSEQAEGAFTSVAETQERATDAAYALNTAQNSAAESTKKLTDNVYESAERTKAWRKEIYDLAKGQEEYTASVFRANKESVDAIKKTEDLAKAEAEAAKKAEEAAWKQSAWNKEIISFTGVAKLATAAIVGMASAAVGLGAGVVALAQTGGELAETKRQFENLAASTGENAAKIIADVKAISNNGLSLKDSFGLAGEALTAGLSGEQIKTAFTFAKRASEATGEDFATLSSTIVTAMSKGRYSTLEAYGVIIDKGADVKTAFEALNTATERFGDTGFNTADLVLSMSTAFGDLKARIGEAINASPEFQSVIESLEKSARQFVEEFDYQAIVDFTDKGIVALGYFKEDVETVFRAMGNVIGGFFSEDFGRETFFESLITGFFTIKGAVASVSNLIVESTKTAFGAIDFAFTTVAKMFVQIPFAVGDMMLAAELAITKGLQSIIGNFESIAARFPKLSKLLGLDDEGMLGGAKSALNSMIADHADAVKRVRQENQDTSDAYITSLDEQAAARSAFFDEGLIDLDELASEEQAAIKRIRETTTATKDLGIAAGEANEDRKKSVLELRQEQERAIEKEKELRKQAEEQAKAEADRAKEVKRRQYEDEYNFAKDALDQRKQLLKDETDAAKKEYKSQLDAKRELFEYGLSDEERAFKRRQEDEARELKDRQEQELGRQLNKLIYGRGIAETEAQQLIEPLKRQQQQDLIELARAQEDATETFKREINERKKAYEAQQAAEAEAFEQRKERDARALDAASKAELEALKRAQADSLANPALPPASLPDRKSDAGELAAALKGALEDMEKRKEQKERTQGPTTVQEKALKIELVNSGSLADTLINIIFKEARLRAIADGTRVVAP